MKRVKARKDDIVRASTEGVENWLEDTDNVTVYRGHGRLESARTVSVNGEVLEADRIFLNVGTRALAPEMPRLEEIDYFTNSNMMDVDFLPRHLIIIGGSYIGLEFAQMYRRFGSEVTVVERGDRLIRRDDEDVSETVREVLEERVSTSASAPSMFASPKAAMRSPAALNATPVLPKSSAPTYCWRLGVPNTDDLGLEQAGVDVDERGYVRVDDELRTNVAGIWALGDCNGKGAFTHTSYNDYEIVAANLFDDDPRRVSDRILCYGLFTDPPLGRIGITEQEARESGRRVLIGKRMMTRVGRTRERSETDGFIKILVDADSEQILAAILGIGGDEVVHALLTAMCAKLPYTVVSRAVHIHPTVAELIPTVLQDLEPLAT